MLKVSKTYRLRKATLQALAELADWLNLDHTAALELAITDLHARKRREGLARLVKRGKGYELWVGDLPVARCGAEVVAQLPEQVRAPLLGSGLAADGVVAWLALAGAKVGAQLELFPATLQAARGPVAKASKGKSA